MHQRPHSIVKMRLRTPSHPSPLSMRLYLAIGLEARLMKPAEQNLMIMPVIDLQSPGSKYNRLRLQGRLLNDVC
jgi:hypothetical protein